ncbi:MAG TPA: T9SS type A sorting domain-containing protein [Bacteroidia bacterium]|nr:T9SS type A sorting domain-containing protein [Bacteroidia bacterium]
MKKIFILFASLCAIKSNAQVWSSVGTGLPSYYLSANVLYNDINKGNLIVGTSFNSFGNLGDTLFSYNGTTLSKYGPKLNYDHVTSLGNYNDSLFCQSGSSYIHEWDYSSSTWTQGFASSTIVDSTFGNLYLINGGGYPFYYNGYSVNSVNIPGFSLSSGQWINKGIVVKNPMGDTVYYCGRFSASTGTNNAVSYSTNGTTWTNIPGTGLPTPFNLLAIAIYNGTIYVGGSYVGGFSLWRWTGSTWNSVTGPTATVHTLKVYDGKLYGSYTGTASTIFSYDGTNFSNIGTSNGGTVSDMNTYGTCNNKLYIVGTFTSVSTISGTVPNTNHIAKYDANLPALTATSTLTPESSVGANDGTATIITSGGLAPYSYFWSSIGQTNSTATGLTGGTYTCTTTDANGCSIVNTVTVTTNVSTGINSHAAPVGMSIYPNPSNGQFTVDAGNATIDVINCFGQNTLHLTVDSKVNIVLDKPGMYFINVNKNGKVYKSRLINQ